MNSANFKTARLYIKNLISRASMLGVLFFAAVFLAFEPVNAWEVDFSRRQVDFEKVEDHDRRPASAPPPESAVAPNLLSQILDSAGPAQDIVVMNTAQGFVPSALRLRKGGNYRIHIVNVNENERNVSFVLDAFSEHHNTVFGKVRMFTLSPKQNGLFSYQCPETATQGRLEVFSDERSLASESSH